MTDHKQNPAEIFLIEVFDGEDYSHIWCDTPAPGEGMKEEDATRYVRADLAPAGNDVLAQCIAKLTHERNAQEAKRWAIQRAAEALLSAGTDAEREEAQRKLNAVVKDEYDYEEVETPRPNYFDYRELQQRQDELQTMLFTERKKSSELTAHVNEQSKVIQHIAAAVGEEADQMACWEAVDALKAQVEQLRDAIKMVRDSSYTKGFGYPDASQVKAQREAWYKLNEALEAQPAQCLAEVKAQAVEEFKSNYKLPCDVMLFPATTFKKGVSLSTLIVGMKIRDEADNQIRQSAKAGD